MTSVKNDPVIVEAVAFAKKRKRHLEYKASEESHVGFKDMYLHEAEMYSALIRVAEKALYGHLLKSDKKPPSKK